MAIKKKITENQLKRIITESVKRILKEMDEIEPGFGDYSDDIPPQGFYICSETNYNDGNVETWIGDENDAQECRQCSEGSAYGPFSTYEEAEQYAEENGMNLGSEDYANNFGNALKDAFGDSLNENRLNKIVAKSVRKTLNEAFMRKKWPSSKPTEPINKKPSPIGMYKKLYPNIKVKPVHGEKDGYNVMVAIGNKGVLIGSKGWEKYIYNPRSKNWIGPYRFDVESIAFKLAAKLEKTMEGPEDSQTKSVRDAYMGGDQYAGMLQEGKKKALKRSKRKLQESWSDNYDELNIYSINIEGEDVTDEFTSYFGNGFDSKYTFKSLLEKFLKEQCGPDMRVVDLDTAMDFGEDGDDIYVLTNPEIDIEIHGKYESPQNGDYSDTFGIVPGVEL